MELEKIINLQGIKLLDTNIFQQKGTNILIELYPCENSEEIPLESILERERDIKERTAYLSKPDVFSISEVADEEQYLLFKLNNSLNFHSRQQVSASEELSHLNSFCKKLSQLIRSIRKKDARETFSDKEKSLYNNFLRYFLYISKQYGLKRDYLRRHELLESHHPCNFQTDEKLISTQLALACTRIKPVILISSDSDIRQMLSFFYQHKEHKRDFKLQEPVYRVPLYSDFGEGFELQALSFD